MESRESESDRSWNGEFLWNEKLGNVRNLVRQALVTRQLMEHLPEPDMSFEILDMGCGQGTQLLELARRGYHVTGVDISSQLLSQAEEVLASESQAVRSRVQLLQGDLLKLDSVVGRRFDAVLCHGVLMYLPSLEVGLNAVASAVKPNGIVSVLTRNQASIAMRAGMTAKWQAALAGFEGRYYDNRVGVNGVRADKLEEVIAALGSFGVGLIGWYGVRLFTDHWGDVEPPEDFELLLAAEEEAGRRDPYRQLTSLTHVIGRRRLSPRSGGGSADHARGR